MLWSSWLSLQARLGGLVSRCAPACLHAGGLPIGAVVMTDAVAAVMAPGDHGSTFAGNPLVAEVRPGLRLAGGRPAVPSADGVARATGQSHADMALL